MTSRGAQLGVVVRHAEWELNDYAFRVPRGEVGDQEAFQLAERLVALADVIRSHHTRAIEQ